MPKDTDELREFTQKVGAEEFRLELGCQFRPRKCFLLKSKAKVLIVKISRSTKPFFGVDKSIIDSLDRSDIDYFLVLLTSNREGWLFSKEEIRANTGDRWRLRKTDNNYKINSHTLPTLNSFSSPDRFLEKIERYAT